MDKINKYEYTNGEFIIDQDNLNRSDLIKAAQNWAVIFSRKKEFENICLEAVRQNGRALGYVNKKFIPSVKAKLC